MLIDDLHWLNKIIAIRFVGRLTLFVESHERVRLHSTKFILTQYYRFLACCVFGLYFWIINSSSTMHSLYQPRCGHQHKTETFRFWGSFLVTSKQCTSLEVLKFSIKTKCCMAHLSLPLHSMGFIKKWSKRKWLVIWELPTKKTWFRSLEICICPSLAFGSVLQTL